MTIAELQRMPMSSAFLCEDCQDIGNDPRRCPSCASQSLMGLANVLNRETVQPAERIARLEQENVQLLASHERLREALQRYRRRDDCKCGTCMNADAALREAEKLEGAWTHMRLINAPRPESADDKAEA